MKKTKHPIVRIDSAVMDDLEKIANDPQKKISKASFASEAIKEKISREKKEEMDILVGEIFEQYKQRADDYYRKGIKNRDEFFEKLVLNKDVLEIKKSQKKLEKEVQEYRDVALYGLEQFKKLQKNTEKMVKKITKLRKKN